MDRLSAGICSHATNKKAGDAAADNVFPMVLAVSEDWGGAGAGNGLGTLYAFQKAHALAWNKYGVDLNAALEQGKVSAGLFHTAGKGTRMAPLPASENNNKPGVVCTISTTVDHVIIIIVLYTVLTPASLPFYSLETPLWLKARGRHLPNVVDCLGSGRHADGHLRFISQGTLVGVLGRPSLYTLGSISVHTHASH
jgi:hypothetical protein